METTVNFLAIQVIWIKWHNTCKDVDQNPTENEVIKSNIHGKLANERISWKNQAKNQPNWNESRKELSIVKGI